jgi:hypothetical protein
MSTVSKLSKHSNDCQSSGKPYKYFPIFMYTYHLLELHFLWLFHPFGNFSLTVLKSALKVCLLYIYARKIAPRALQATPQ